MLEMSGALGHLMQLCLHEHAAIALAAAECLWAICARGREEVALSHLVSSAGCKIAGEHSPAAAPPSCFLRGWPTRVFVQSKC